MTLPNTLTMNNQPQISYIELYNKKHKVNLLQYVGMYGEQRLELAAKQALEDDTFVKLREYHGGRLIEVKNK